MGSGHEPGDCEGIEAPALPLYLVLTCVRWYVAYPLSQCHLEQMMAGRGVAVDHSTVHRWALKRLPALHKAFRRCKRPVGKSWRMDETYILVRGQWKYLYRTVDNAGNTRFLLGRHRAHAYDCQGPDAMPRRGAIRPRQSNSIRRRHKAIGPPGLVTSSLAYCDRTDKGFSLRGKQPRRRPAFQQPARRPHARQNAACRPL
ncbi:hypothetical protein CNECB9_2360015 [Cupriavidus necator]|uniref:DDE domain-containing protein n=1 Tax=Cupriavidus necator TaxID=106590 RepID=A0A1K0J8K6_CUPNE|nr:hypothetical protein CNECB9_2360015 [Cupriavidus necator]